MNRFIPETRVKQVAELGGPVAERWMRHAAGVRVVNRETARIVYLCLNRAFNAATYYDPPQYVKDKQPTKAWSDEGAVLRHPPIAAVINILCKYWQRLESFAPGVGVDCSPPRRPVFSPDELYRRKWKHQRRRMRPHARKAENRAERVRREVKIDQAIQRAKHPSFAALQQQEDNEARLRGDRVY